MNSNPLESLKRAEIKVSAAKASAKQAKLGLKQAKKIAKEARKQLKSAKKEYKALLKKSRRLKKKSKSGNRKAAASAAVNRSQKTKQRARKQTRLADTSRSNSVIAAPKAIDTTAFPLEQTDVSPGATITSGTATELGAGIQPAI